MNTRVYKCMCACAHNWFLCCFISTLCLCSRKERNTSAQSADEDLKNKLKKKKKYIKNIVVSSFVCMDVIKILCVICARRVHLSALLFHVIAHFKLTFVYYFKCVPVINISNMCDEHVKRDFNRLYTFSW